MLVKNWTLIDDDEGKYNHPAGGFVIRITEVTDNPMDEYLNIEYEIAEGERAGEYQYSREFRRYYGATSEKQFRRFLGALQKSNPAFDLNKWQRTANERDLIGLEVGAVFKEYQYTSLKGEDRKRPKFCYPCAADDIRQGRFKMPEPEDARVRAEAADDDDVPFI